MNMFTSSSKNSDDGLKASYNISLLIAKAGKSHTIGEELILPAVKEVIKTVLHTSPEQVIKSILLSDNSVQQRVDKMAENVEETLNKFSLQLDESTLPGNDLLLLAYVRFIKGDAKAKINCKRNYRKRLRIKHSQASYNKWMVRRIRSYLSLKEFCRYKMDWSQKVNA